MNYQGNQLFETINSVRQRRNLLFWLRGIAITLAVGAGLLLLTGWAGYKYRYNTGALISLRVAALVGVLTAIYLALVRPLRRKVSDAQLARLIEEKQPGLDDALVSAVEFSERGALHQKQQQLGMSGTRRHPSQSTVSYSIRVLSTVIDDTKSYARASSTGYYHGQRLRQIIAQQISSLCDHMLLRDQQRPCRRIDEVRFIGGYQGPRIRM